jgi:tetratricopeptide (TPR) repeat protein
MTGVLSAWIVGLTVLLASTAGPAENSQTGLDPRLAAVYQAAYNLDQDTAIAGARAAVAALPNDSNAHRTLAAMLWLDIIFRRGTVTVDHYVGGLGPSARTLPKPPAAVDAEFKRHVGIAIDLAAKRVEADRNDVQARFELGSAYGLQASYLASVEGSMTSALMSARHAFNAQEEVLNRDPKRSAAGVVVGTYRYMVSGLALPSRMFAYMVGFGGGKDEGIKLLEAATRDPGAFVEARTALVLIYSREGRHADAYRVLGEIVAAYPRNRLFVLEQGSAAIRAGRHSEADALLSSGLQALDRDTRPRIPGERGLWLYKRGLARFGRDRRAEATADLQEALRNSPPDWVRGRAFLTLGKIADLNGQRTEAVGHYRTARETSARARDTSGSAEATRLLARPYSRPKT